MKYWIAAILLVMGFEANAGDAYYKVEALPDPPTALKLEVGGLNFADDGTLYVGTRRGEVWAWKDQKWTLFASGLAECLGTLPVGKGAVIVTQRGEVTRLVDVDGDGVADRYEKITQNFGYTGNYHEFNFGLVRDACGWLYGTLNLAHTGHDPWGSTFMGADIKDRGTAYRISPEGKYETVAWGLRSPNGITMSCEGEIFCVDSQGEYVATNCLQHLQAGRFYGHPASLSFKPGFTGSPKTTTIADLGKMRTPPCVWIPYTRMGKSVTEPRFDETAGKFGPFEGQIFCGDTTMPIVTRIFLEKVGDDYQGACFPFLTDPLLEGANRFAFGPDGALYTGLTNRGWVAETNGLRKIAWSGTMPLEIQKIELQRDGFKLTYTEKGKGFGDAANYSVVKYRYEYHSSYGSDELDKAPVKIIKAKVGKDSKTVRLILPEVLAGWIYEINVQHITAKDGCELRNTLGWYTVNHLVVSAP